VIQWTAPATSIEMSAADIGGASFPLVMRKTQTKTGAPKSLVDVSDKDRQVAAKASPL